MRTDARHPVDAPGPRSIAPVWAAVALAVFTSACDDTPTSPSRGATVTFQVANERFRVQLIDPRQVTAAHDAATGGAAQIPSGRIVAGTGVNLGWSWHLEDVEFAEVTTELCDGRPSDVEREGVRFGGGRFCPWAARVVLIEEH